MPDYKEMYLVLFRETTKAITALQKAQQTTEEMYITDEENDNPNDADLCIKTDEKSHPLQG